MELADKTLCTLITTNIALYKDKELIVGIGEHPESRSYKQLNDKRFSQCLEKFPKNVCLGVCIGTEPCIPMLIYSLMEKQVCFMFLDPDDSLEKLEKTVTDLKLYGVITRGDKLHNWPQFSETNTVETECGTALNLYVKPIYESGNYGGFLYVISTSGTCGDVKYVRVTETCIKSNVLCLRRRMNITSSDVIYFGTPLTFDPSMIELFLALTTGAQLTTVTKAIHRNPPALLKALFPNDSNGVTFLQMCPSVFTRWSEHEIQHILMQTALRILALGGEAFPQWLAKAKRKPSLRIFNIYGITEVSCWASVCEIDEHIPISLGDALDDTILDVRDENGCSVKEGCGEMFIGSTSRICLLNDETLDDINLPLFRSTGDLVQVKNNTFTYQGRLNRVVKRFGCRVNLSALEESIRAKVDLDNVCVWDEKTHKISTFLQVPDSNENDGKVLDKIRVELLRGIESKCFPDYLEIIREIPLTTNGKRDLKAIEDLQPKTYEELYKQLWCKYLCITNVESTTDNTFMELGGSSVIRMQFVSELKSLSKGGLDSDFINRLLEINFGKACELLQTGTAPNRLRRTERFKVNWYSDMLMCIDAPATVFTYSERLCVAVGNFANTFAVYDARSGMELYKTLLPKTIENACSASAETGRLCIGCFDGIMYCIDVEEKLIAWRYSTGDRIKNTGCFCKGGTSIVFGSYDNCLHCVKLKDGVLVWKRDVKAAITSNPITTASTIIAATIKGTIVCLNEESGGVIWRYQAKRPIFTDPKMLNDCVLYSDVGGYIHCINAKTGNSVWIYKPSSTTSMYSTFTLFKNYLVFGMNDKKIHFLRLTTDGASKYSHCVDVGHVVNAEPKVFHVDEEVYFLFTSIDGHLLLYKLIGEDLWLVDSMSLDVECFAQPVFHDKTMFIGCRDNHFYSIDVDI